MPSQESAAHAAGIEGEEADGQWISADPSSFSADDLVRVTHRRSGTVHIGTVVSNDGNGWLSVRHPTASLRDGTEAFNEEYRTFEKWIPAETPASDGWGSVTLDMLAVRDRVRITHRHDEGNRLEADVVGLGCSMGSGGRDDGTVGRAVQLVGDGGIRFCAHRDTWNFERLVTEQAPGPVLSRPQVGDRFTRRFNHPGFADRAGCVVRTVRDAGEAPGQTLWLLTYDDANGRYWDSELLVRPDGTCNSYVPSAGEMRDTTGMYVPEVAVQSSPTGWVPVTNFEEELHEDDIVRAVPNDIGGLMQARVTRVTDYGYTAMTTHVIEESSNGRSIDLTCWGSGYEYGNERGHNTVVWRGVMPPPAPDAEPLIPEERRQAATTSAEGSLPAWATSLDAAKRHVHAVARRLYRRGDNCYDGSTDFVEALGLPSVGEDWAAPVPVDETEQIRTFLTKVREVALEVADDHGKDTDLVEQWLTEAGIVKPALPPVSFTVTVTAPAGTTLDEVRRLGYSIDGWEVR